MKGNQMLSNHIDEELVKRCVNIDSPEDYKSFSEEIFKRKPIPFDLKVFNENSHESQIEQAKFLLSLTKTKGHIDTRLLQSILAEENSNFLVASACYYVLQNKASDIPYIQGLILSPDSVTPLEISNDAAFFLTSFMGYSGNTNFIPLLHDILTTNYHFISQSLSAEALENLGAKQDEEEIPYNRSIRVLNIQNEITLYSDEKYTGSSNCPSCQFFPCKVNHYYSGGIQDCDLFNATNPNTLENIVDKRDWGNEGHLDTQKVTTHSATDIWKQARICMMNKSYIKAIPLLCSSILSTGKLGSKLDSSIDPLAWIYLSRCFSESNEKKLAFIALREVHQNKNRIPTKMIGERNLVNSFNASPESILGNTITYTNDFMERFMETINYRKGRKWVRAFDCYIDDNILDGGKEGGYWSGIGECCYGLQEYHLAELFITKAASVSREGSQNEKFRLRAEEVYETVNTTDDIGLSVEYRKQERRENTL